MAKTSLPQITEATPPWWGRVRVPSALKYPGFRNYWLGLLASVTGYQMLALFTLGWLISHELTGDARYLGYMSTAIAVPAIGLNLFGGALADKLNPKRLLALTQSTTGALVLGLAILTQLDMVNEWHVLAAAFLIGSAQAFDNPTRQSIFPRLVERKALFSAIALNASLWTGTRIISPTIAGIIVGQASTAVAIFVSATGFVVLSLVSLTLKIPPLERARGSVLNEMIMGFRFIKASPIFSTLIAMTFFNSIFGMSYVILMPVFADDVLKVGPEKIGLLMGAAGLGALTGIGIGSRLSKARLKGWVLLGGAFLYGIFLMLFALTSNANQYGLSMVVLFLGDMCISIYVMMVITTLQSLVPDHLRGRIMGFFTMTWSLIPLGGLQSSQIAHLIGAPAAVAIGGGLVSAVALGVALTTRHVRNLGAPSDEF